MFSTSRKLAPWSSALRKQAVLKLIKHTQLSLDGALGKGLVPQKPEEASGKEPRAELI